MNWDTIQQVLRIVLYAAGGALLGKSVTDGAQFQALVGGLLSVGSFVWWWFWDRNRTA
jgi:hypothetical protein